MEIQEKINALMENEAFRAEFANVTNAQEVVALFGKNGVEVPEAIAQELFVPMTADETEMTEASLEDVAGGGSVGAGIGTAIGNGIFYGAGYLGGRLAGWSKKKSKAYAKSCGKFGATFGAICGGLLIPA